MVKTKTITLPEYLIEKITREAEREHRSVSSQISYILIKEFEKREAIQNGKTQIDMEAFR